MKKLLLMALAILSMSAAAQEVAVKPFNVRYIDEDRLYQQYVVAQQYLQLQSQLKNDLQQAEKKKRTQIENFYNQVQTKYKNNQYKTQKAFEADQKKLETMQELRRHPAQGVGNVHQPQVGCDRRGGRGAQRSLQRCQCPHRCGSAQGRRQRHSRTALINSLISR